MASAHGGEVRATKRLRREPTTQDHVVQDQTASVSPIHTDITDGCRASGARRGGGLLRAILRRGSAFAQAGRVRAEVPLDKTLVGLTERAYDMCATPLSCEQLPDDTVEILLVGGYQGHFHLVDCSEVTPRVVSFRYNEDLSTLFDVSWLTKTSVVIGTSDGTLGVTDLNTSNVLSCEGHSRAVKSVATAPGSEHVFVSGGRDGAVRLWDIRIARRVSKCGKSNRWAPVNDIACAHGTPNSYSCNSVTAVAYVGCDHLVASGGSDGTVKLWDMRRAGLGLRPPTPVVTVQPPLETGGTAVTSLAADYTGKTVVVSRLNGSVAVHDNMRTTAQDPSPSLVLRDNATSTSFDVKASITPDGRYVTCGSPDGAVHAWDLPQHRVAPRTSGWQISSGTETAEVHAARWLRTPTDVPKFAVLSHDTVRIWSTSMRPSQQRSEFVAAPLSVERLPSPPCGTTPSYTHLFRDTRHAPTMDVPRRRLFQPQLNTFYPTLES
eukprot:m.112046 g.112046  ORF g.112046 m.112046 type:complete len:493 (-) comp21398_c0_seq1:50-1528(-)